MLARMLLRSSAYSASFYPRFFSMSSQVYASPFAQDPIWMWAEQQLSLLPKLIKMVQKDIAGTVADEFCVSPYVVFDEIFKEEGLQLTPEEITGPMGSEKKAHIKHIIEQRRAYWKEKYGRYPNDDDVDALHAKFTARLKKVIPKYNDLTPGADMAADFIIRQGMLLALTSGYAWCDAKLASAKFTLKYRIDAMTTADRVRNGKRIEMIEKNMQHLNLANSEMQNTIFITDARSDLDNVRSAKNHPWIFAVSGASTHMGVTSREHLNSLSPAQLQKKQEIAAAFLQKGRPHAVLNNMLQVPLALVAVARALVRGQVPTQTESLVIEGPGMDFSAYPPMLK